MENLITITIYRSVEGFVAYVDCNDYLVGSGITEEEALMDLAISMGDPTHALPANSRIIRE